MTTESLELKALLKSLEHPNLKAIDLSLGRMERHLAAIGNPETRIPPVIHVAGTNGKGSTLAFLRSIFETSGYRCHVFTSPHLVHVCERWVVAGRTLEEAELIERLSAIKVRMEKYPLTFFEANAVLAFELFAEHPADVTLLEVGMGGRFDATNVVDEPCLSIITPISMDHQTYLGDTLGKIAFEKAGILKSHHPAVIAPQAPDAAQVIKEVAAEKQVPLIWAEPQTHASLGMQGEHQQMNASVATRAAHEIKSRFDRITDDTVRDGLVNASWPGRLQPLTRGPLIDALPAGATCWLDGGHNQSAGEMLAAWIAQQPAPHTLICAMTDQKDPLEFLQPFAGILDSVICTTIPDEPRMLLPEKLAQAATDCGMEMKVVDSVERAITHIPDNSTLLIAGSLYLAGYVLQKNQ